VPVRWLARGTVGALMHSYVRVRTHGRENIPEKGAFILAPNHSSHLDGPAVLTAVGGKRRVWIAGAEDYFFNSAMKRFVFGKLFDTIPFDRQADGIAGLRRCGDALSRGDGLLMFPEGTRSLNGRVHEFKVGVAVLAMQRGVPIVPVYIHRAYALWRKGSHFVRPGIIEVSFGKPVYPPEVDDKAGRHAAFFALARQVEDAVRQLASSGT
jgi:long-chain acyl-CoA synthetase